MASETTEKRKSRLERFIERLNRQLIVRDARNRLYSRIRLVIAITGIAVAYTTYQRVSEPVTWLIIIGFVILFSVAVFLHNRVIVSIRKHHYYKRIKTAHIARISRDWENIPVTPGIEVDPDILL